MMRLVTYFDLTVETKGEGSFVNQDLQEFYNDVTGATSPVEAFRVGALIEEIDIKDLREAIALAKANDVEVLEAVYSNLLNASYNHLRAFVRNYEANGGGTYVPQTAVSGLSAADVKAILGRN